MRARMCAQQIDILGARLFADPHGEMTCLDRRNRYLTANLAMMLVVGFGRYTVAFRFEEGTSILTGGAILSALAAQQVPELLGDSVCIWFVHKAGLPILTYYKQQLEPRNLLPKVFVISNTLFTVLGTLRGYF